jgi:hypothetical protein
MRPPDSSTVPAASRYERLRARAAKRSRERTCKAAVCATAAKGARLVRSLTPCLTYAFCALPMKETLGAGSAA